MKGIHFIHLIHGVYMPKAVMFDLGDTVLEEISYSINSGYKELSPYLTSNISLDKLHDAINRGQTEISEFKLQEWINSNLNAKGSELSAEKIELLLWNQTVKLSPKHGVKEALEFLKKRGIKIAAISNTIFSSYCIKNELEKHNLGSYFEAVISSADNGIRKPSVDIFKKTLRDLEVQPNDAWYIGDKWETDVLGSVKAGMTAVWYAEKYNETDSQTAYIKLNNWYDFFEVWHKYA